MLQICYNSQYYSWEEDTSPAFVNITANSNYLYRKNNNVTCTNRLFYHSPDSEIVNATNR